MALGISKFVGGLVLSLAAITATQGADFISLDEALPKGGNTTRYSPVFDFDGDGCLPAAGISREGIQNPGESTDTGQTAFCRDPNFLNTSNTLHRYACITDNGSDYCGHFYSLYFEKDECSEFVPFCGHVHDWEYVAVWTTDSSITHVCASAHGECFPVAASSAPFDGDHVMIVYHQEDPLTHAMRFANSGDIANPENPYGAFVTPVVVSWYELTGDVFNNKEMRDRLNSFDYGSATIPLKDGGYTFLNNLNHFKPPDYPLFTQARLDASNPNNPMLAFIEGDGSFSGEGTEYLLEFGQIPVGRHRLIAELAVKNEVYEPADNLDGDFDTTAAAPYLVTGFNSFTGLASGGLIQDLIVEIPTAGHWPGFVTGEIVFQPKGLVDTGVRVPLDPITLTMSLEILPPPEDDDDDDDDDNFFGCSMSQNLNQERIDPTLILMTMIAIVYIGMRRRKTAH